MILTPDGVPASQLVPSGGGDGISEQDVLQAEADLGRADLYYFNKHILQLGEGSPIQRPQEEIEPLCVWLQKPIPAHVGPKGRFKRFLALPRGCGKTFTVAGYVAWRIVRNPNIAIFFTSEEKAQASASVRFVSEKLSGPRVEALYGKMRGEKDWTQHRFTVANRNRARREPTVMSGGVDVPVQGWHFDLIIADDLQGKTNNTPEGIAKVKEYLSLLWPVLNPGGELIWICTRWDYDDAAADILKQRSQDKTSWDALGDRGFFGAYATPADTPIFPSATVGEPLFPSVLPRSELERLKASMPLYQFSCQYDNDPIPSEAQYFRSSDFQYVPAYDATATHYEGLVYYMGVDTASGLDTVKKGDDTAIIVIGVRGQERHRTITVVEVVGGQWKPLQIMTTMQTMYEKWRPRTVGLETAGAGKMFYAGLKEWMQKEMVWLPIRELPHAGTDESKADRIATLEPEYRARRIFHAENLRGSKLEEQLLRFKPGGRAHDDYPDALAMAVETIRPGHLGQAERNKRRNRLLTYQPIYPDSTGY